MNELMNDKAVYRTDPARPGLVNIYGNFTNWRGEPKNMEGRTLGGEENLLGQRVESKVENKIKYLGYLLQCLKVLLSCNLVR